MAQEETDGSQELRLKFTYRELQDIKKACERILGKEVTWDQVVFQIAFRCKMEIKSFVKSADQFPIYPS
jgi:hypothetical protein